MSGENDNYNFVQVQKSHMKQWRELIQKQPLSAEIMFYFMEVMGKNTNAVVCSYKTLQEVTGYSRPSVGRAIKTLKDMNWIDSVKVGSATAYAVNERIVWQSGKNQRRYAMFSATVVASESEQEKGFAENNHKIKHIPFIERTERVIVSNDELPPPDQQELNLE
ncbi:replication/maintenance protein RepL [Vibrio parahaemolyticus]|uniref:replication/maintenance protein RepL n=2 Tax=Vibrio parahaemolyticus TaxID=670 RepID=UPI00215C611B|nr:replication/maintenance protein RepL [Vibrio parahaemolyticus]MCR9953803.1 replication/maintenance protein RepL [Vibrio parahaemolyticus]MDF4792175.1 replication/maintenance protein RepL [Vibrio parahaemolyticus]MDF5014944.1 replication/maintenance protein RepL [Vibrio parahaemolyticus]HCH5615190.1 replication/maintenance protein RepL [Vibrio parahaemolyticus]HCH5920386.1 replication/maintenance protein RepL [Vibrio parahaemolyticus]